MRRDIRDRARGLREGDRLRVVAGVRHISIHQNTHGPRQTMDLVIMLDFNLVAVTLQEVVIERAAVCDRGFHSASGTKRPIVPVELTNS